MSSELDILIVGHNEERFSTDIRQAFRHWQVYSVAAPHALMGRRFRRAYVTEGAYDHHRWSRVGAELDRYLKFRPESEVLPFSDYRPEYSAITVGEADDLRQIRRSRHPAA